MQHGNKKYNFEDLKESGDTIVVKPANIYSLKNSLRLFSKENGIEYPESFDFQDAEDGQVKVTRIS